jgi:hypothetical protein
MKKILVMLSFVLSTSSIFAQQGTASNTKPADSAVQLTGEYKGEAQQPHVNAQMEMEQILREREYSHREEVFRSGSIIFTLILVMVFVVIMVRTFLDNKLRHKILQNNVQPDSLHALLDLTPQDRKVTNLRWVYILAGIGIGLLLVSTLPLGITAIAVMCLSLAASFLAFHWFVLRKS